MARATPVPAARSGFTLTPNLTAAVVDGDIVPVNSRVWVHNGSGSPITVTAQVTAAVQGLDVEDLVVSVAAGADALVGPLTQLFKQPDDATVGPGMVLVDYSAVTSVTRGVVTT